MSYNEYDDDPGLRLTMEWPGGAMYYEDAWGQRCDPWQIGETKVYLASEYGRKQELLGCAQDLVAHNVGVTSRWLFADPYDSKNVTVEDPDISQAPMEGRDFALEDLANIDEAHVFICFTSETGRGSARGGRHVEFGYAVARGKRLIVVGPRENIFYTLPNVEHHAEWETVVPSLTGHRL